MASGPIDILVAGSTPLAGLLAGLLATAHGKSVCVVGEATSAFRLSRGFDLSVAPLTRPATWMLLTKAVPETMRLVAKINARQALVYLDPLFVADGEASADVLAHLRQVAIGNGHAVNRVTLRTAADGRTAIAVRDSVMLLRKPFEAALGAWLATAGVMTLPVEGTRITLRRDGSARIERDGVQHNAMDVVLADDAAILTLLGREAVAPVLLPMATTAIQTERVRSLPSRYVDYLDRGVRLYQSPSGQISALAQGASESATGHLRSCLAGVAPVRRAGQVTFHQLTPRDGAPVFGSLKGSRIRMVAGLGPIGFFLAPALARAIIGTPTAEEASYFGERSANVDIRKASVADFGI